MRVDPDGSGRGDTVTVPFYPVRAGFSAIDGNVHLHPHCGGSNTQLKLHLGLIVPMQPAPTSSSPAAATTGLVSPPRPCAEMRVGNQTRPWRAGKVLLFDDSWEHEVWNWCGTPTSPGSAGDGGDPQAFTRVVFQLVFRHPELR